MISTEHWLVHDHTKIESILTKIRALMDTQDWDGIKNELHSFVSSLGYHMGQEEDVLFPAYEDKVGDMNPPVVNLRDEHELINDTVCDVATALDARDVELFEENFSYLESVMLAHHEKEEMIFLPMASHILFEEREELTTKLNSYKGPGKARDWGLN